MIDDAAAAGKCNKFDKRQRPFVVFCLPLGSAWWCVRILFLLARQKREKRRMVSDASVLYGADGADVVCG